MLVHFRRCFLLYVFDVLVGSRWFVPVLHVCLVILAGSCLWYILDWNFRDARGVYNSRLCGRSFSCMSIEVVAVRRVGVFVLVDLRKPNLCVWGGNI